MTWSFAAALFWPFVVCALGWVVAIAALSERYGLAALMAWLGAPKRLKAHDTGAMDETPEHRR